MIKILLTLILLAYPEKSYADSRAAERIISVLCPFWEVIVVASFITGVALVISSLVHVSRIGSEQGNKTNSGYGVAVTIFMVGVFLISLEQIMFMLSAPFLTSGSGPVVPTPCMEISEIFGQNIRNKELNNVFSLTFLILIFLGWISFFKGWLLIKGRMEGRIPSFGNGITFIVAGILMANIDWVDGVLGTLFGRSEGLLQSLLG